jgi:hypothetical protein
MEARKGNPQPNSQEQSFLARSPRALFFKKALLAFLPAA